MIAESAFFLHLARAESIWRRVDTAVFRTGPASPAIITKEFSSSISSLHGISVTPKVSADPAPIEFELSLGLIFEMPHNSGTFLIKHRRSNPLVPDWFYRREQDGRELEAARPQNLEMTRGALLFEKLRLDVFNVIRTAIIKSKEAKYRIGQIRYDS